MNPKSKLRRVAYAALVPSVAVLWYLQRPKDMEVEIRSQRYELCERTGWLNWSHAKPDGPKKLLVDAMAKKHVSSADEAFTVDYSQSMSGTYLGIKISSGVRHTYELSSTLTDDQVEQICFMIFRNVSDDFECFQGSFPSCIDRRASDSSYRAGDLLGNLISFHCALNSSSEKEARSWFVGVNTERAIQAFKIHPPAKSSQWPPSDLLPSAIKRVIPNQELFDSKARLVNRQTWYFSPEF